MTGRGHQLIHSDAFAAELEAMGLDQSIFGPHLPAPIFQALVPRRAGVFDEHAHTFGTGDEPAAFTRASDGIYLDSDGNYQVAAANAIRAEHSAAGAFLGYLFEPAITNKCTNYNFQPDVGLQNVTSVGAALSRVFNTALLESVGLSGLGNGYLIRGEGGSGDRINVNGPTGNLNVHTVSVWARVISGDANLRIGGGAFPTNQPIGGEFKRYVASGAAPATFGVFEISFTAASTIVEFVGNQLEESSVITSSIITQGASGTRAIDGLSWAAGLAGWSDAEGVVLLDWTPGWSLADVAAGSTIKPDIWRQTSGVQGLYWEHTAGGLSRIVAREGGGTLAAGGDMGAHPVAGTAYRAAVRWNAGTSEFEPGIKVAGAWIWPAAAGAYTGTWAADVWQLAPGAALPMYLKRCAVFNRDMSRATIERLF